ncbi:MAG: AlpA family phage regulatory protein [Gallionellaceae bacterium]|nr:AlpA family phage regulatory protein [Gallionellaceae bacterium]
MRQQEVLTLVPFSAATLWRRVRAGTFVKPVKLGPRITAWNRGAVLAWLDQQQGTHK